MRYALSLPNGGECADPATMAGFARLAEEAGWDAILLEDYLWYANPVYDSVPGAPTYDAWITLAAMAGSTSTIRLGTCVTPLSRWRPWQLARVTVSLDHLSGGRLILGVGLGDPADPGFSRFHEVIDPRERAELLDEGLTVLTGLWSGEPFQHHGPHYHVDEVTFLPRPVQTPRIPIWVGGSARTAAVLRRAARYDGICPYKLPDTRGWEDFSPEDIRALRDAVVHHRTTDNPFEIVVGGRQRGADWDRERTLIGTLAAAGATWWNEWVAASDLATMHAAIARGPLRIPERT